MTLYEENAVIREVADLMADQQKTTPLWWVSQRGGWFGYWEEINRRGQFKLADGRVVVLEPAEVRLAMDLAERLQETPPPENPIPLSIRMLCSTAPPTLLDQYLNRHQ